MKKLMTLCYIHDGDKVLLGMKKRGFGEGNWNGFGGKVKEGETFEQTAVREVEEEASIKVNELEKRGIMRFRNEGEDILIEVHIYRVLDYEGDPVESEEMKPQWFKHSQVPYDDMWNSDPLWFPQYLDGKLFQGEALFRGFDEVLEHNINEVKELE